MKITKSQLKQIIKEELELTMESRELDEGLENVTPENLQLVADAAQHFIRQPEVLAATIGTAGVALINQLATLFKRAPASEEELEESYGRHDYGAVFDSQGEPEIASPYRKKPKKSYGGGMSDVDRKAWEKRQAERDPDREYIEMIKRIMKDMGMRISAVPGDERQNRLLDQAIEELEMEQKRPAGGGLGGPGGKARYPTPEEIEAARRYKDNK